MITFATAADDLMDLRDRLRAAPDVSAEVTLVAVDDEGADLAAVDGAVQWGVNASKLATLLGRAPRVRWLHSPGAGVESWPLDELRRRQITLTNAAGVFAIPIAEWVLSVMLAAATRARAVEAAQAEHRWADDLVSGELFGRTLLVLGSGGIGQQIIERAAAFGMRIWAASRSGRAVPGAERALAGEEWHDALSEADVVVSTLPLTAATRGSFTADDVARLRPDAWFVNVGRGGTVDEEALLDAAEAGRIGGAALDTWLTEPLPAEHRAWDLDNVVVSPHRSGSSAAGRDRGLDLLADNLRRFVAGEPLRNIVDLDTGY